MFFNKKNRVEYNIVNEVYKIFSLYNRKTRVFYSLVLFKHKQQFLNNLCFTFDKCSDKEFLKFDKDNLDLFEIGTFNSLNGEIESKVKFLGKFIDLINDYEIKKFKGDSYERVADKGKKDSNSL